MVMDTEPRVARVVEAAQVVDAAEAFLWAVSGFDPAQVAPLDCIVVSETAARVEKAAEALRLLAGSRAIRAGAHKEMGVADPATWLARQGGTTGREARQGLELAGTLDALPKTKEALLEGAVSVAQAKEIANAASELAGTEEELVEVAKAGDLTRLRDEVRERRLSSTPVGDLHRRQLAARRFRHFRDGLGMVRIEGALPPETGIPLVTRIEREAARAHKEAKRHGSRAPFEAYAADALVAVCTGREDGAGTAKGRRPSTELVIVCDLYAWRRGHAHEGEPCQLLGGGPVPVDVAKALADDAFVKAILHDGKAVLEVAHFGRRYTAALRTALDVGPVPAFSGRACARCGRTFGLERDHEVPIAQNGPTSYGNVQDLCYPCHAEKTEQDRKAGRLGPRAKARAPAPPPWTRPPTAPDLPIPTAPDPPAPDPR
ncbi:MAG TPA: HNH endonuclease [Acidimicrobiales bacterium]|nr:HNH endonuclease [Acidimicrobiales bacterium]